MRHVILPGVIVFGALLPGLKTRPTAEEIRPAVVQVVPADIVLLNGTVITVDPRDTVAEAVAVRDGRIVFVCATRRRCCRRTDARDRSRGTNGDPRTHRYHVHFSEPADTLDLGDALSMDDVIAKVRARAATASAGMGRGGGGTSRCRERRHHRCRSTRRPRSSRLPHAHDGHYGSPTRWR